MSNEFVVENIVNDDDNDNQDNDAIGFHPLIPSVANAQKNGYQADHAPVRSSIATKYFGVVNIATWNVFGSGEGGFDAPFTPKNEAPKEALHNKKALIKNLNTIACNDEYDFVLIQEIEAFTQEDKQDTSKFLSVAVENHLSETQLEFAHEYNQKESLMER